ncbi:MAG: hypothetical protein WCY48_01505 [Candidatus Caldatribacteriota bacterium]
MRYLILSLVISTFSLPAFSQCKVYGISDSPQRLNCTLGQLKINLTCKKNSYFLNREKVSLAFHMEVEEGATPLVFKTTSGKTLIVLPEDNILAEYEDGKEYHQGSCTK